MRLITRFELASKPTSELHGMLRTLFNKLASTKANTPERSNTLASIENIRNELGSRAP